MSDDYGDDPSSAVLINPNGSIVGVVNYSDDYDLFRINLIAGQSYVFTLTSNQIDSYLTLGEGPPPRVLAEDDDSAGGYNSQITYTASRTGVHYLEASSWGEIGSYILTATTVGELNTATNGNDTLTGSSQADAINALGGNDSITGGASDDLINGGGGTDTSIFSGNLSNYTLTRVGSTYTVRANSGTDGTDTVTNVESLKFADKTVNLTVQSLAASVPQADVQRIEELYVAFFNRVPDADGLAYWIGQKKAGQSIDQIAESFYNAGMQYSSLTGFSSTMSNDDFVNVIYRNVLGRSEGADSGGLAYWSGALANHTETHGSLVSTILGSAHTYKGDATWGWVADLLDNKITVANQFAVDWGLNYNTPDDSITQGMAIAAAVTPTSTAAAIALIGLSASDMNID